MGVRPSAQTLYWISASCTCTLLFHNMGRENRLWEEKTGYEPYIDKSDRSFIDWFLFVENKVKLA